MKKLDLQRMILQEAKLLLFEGQTAKIGKINYIVSIATNFNGSILQFTFATAKDHDAYMENQEEIKKQVEAFVKKLGFKKAYQRNNDLGGISILLDKDELLLKILK